MTDIVLSICIISCNQRDLLKRCFESVMRQDLPFSYEIIMSDDHSTDGTWELIEEYQRKYPKIVKGVHCYLEETNPTCNSERCGWNKLTAYLNAKGKYVVNLDADDYLQTSDVYKRSVERLEEHPECSMCFHKVLNVRDGEPLESGYSRFDGILEDGQMITAHDAIVNRIYDVNPAYVMRKNYDVDMKHKLGKYFDDTTITYCHFLYGKAIFLDSFGYVYVKYSGSISNTSTQSEKIIEGGVDPFLRIQQLPDYAGLFMKYVSQHGATLWKERYAGKTLPNNKKMSYVEYRGFVFEYFRKEHHSICECLRAAFNRYFFYVIKLLKINSANPKYYKMLYALVTSKKNANEIPYNYWQTCNL